jgi:hypothetical protein
MSEFKSLMAAVVLALGATPAVAATVPLDLTQSIAQLSGGATTQTSGSGTATLISNSGPTSFGFSDAFNGALAGQTGSAIGPTPATCGQAGSSACYGFYDDFKISLTGGSVTDAVSISINGPSTAGVESMQIRLYSADLNPSPLTGAVAPTGTAFQSWLTVTDLGGGLVLNTATLGISPLTAGNYWVEVRGIVTGASGGYGGTINFTPVPLPAALPLLLAGLGALGVVSRRRRPLA